MTPAEKAKAVGLKSLTQVSGMTGQSLQTLGNWATNKPDLFKVVLAGCKALSECTHCEGSGEIYNEAGEWVGICDACNAHEYSCKAEQIVRGIGAV